ncbi:hypothetical protein, partial [Helicobacter pylori]|uniref:hypothetical protein n=1 Tax=Helicobacter pylori TaxID=210 RepID=UPI001C7DFDDD
MSAAARTVGLPLGTVRNWLVKQGVHTPAPAPPRKIVSQEVKDKAVARVAAGESPYAVAEDIGVSFTTVYDWMNKAGVVGPQVAARRDRQEQ